ncbi:WxL domain-containing protein [Bombilactobacillus folatiphilus]|uniref:WxL domain-containing protein n=1 Tax=Bombilactobacillus folatiphilus TaxID=2923362 RepID=A0ABY4P823_9LACO|nr:WxL domain-containing protein [Bombilactobacillus folatiphilus]UQS81860.1 WxL domain-containing protein [Bombilactobacillus folatiphilus]
MKMNKLFASVATAVVALAAVAPVASVSAAGNDLPSNTSDQIDDKTGSTSATSTASVKVVSGFLSLDKVPDLSFNPAVKGADFAYLQDNGDLKSETNNQNWGDNGNSDGVLQVSDSRNDVNADLPADASQASGAGETSFGYTVSVQLGNFEGKDGNVVGSSTAADAATNGAFALDFTKAVQSDMGYQSNANVIASAGAATSSPLIVVPENNKRGSDQFKFDHSAGIRMNLPKSINTGAYTAPITWNLSAAAQ